MIKHSYFLLVGYLRNPVTNIINHENMHKTKRCENIVWMLMLLLLVNKLNLAKVTFSRVIREIFLIA